MVKDNEFDKKINSDQKSTKSRKTKIYQNLAKS